MYPGALAWDGSRQEAVGGFPGGSQELNVLSWLLPHSHLRCFYSAGILLEREGAPGDGKER